MQIEKELITTPTELFNSVQSLLKENTIREADITNLLTKLETHLSGKSLKPLPFLQIPSDKRVVQPSPSQNSPQLEELQLQRPRKPVEPRLPSFLVDEELQRKEFEEDQQKYQQQLKEYEEQIKVYEERLRKHKEETIPEEQLKKCEGNLEEKNEENRNEWWSTEKKRAFNNWLSHLNQMLTNEIGEMLKSDEQQFSCQVLTDLSEYLSTVQLFEKSLKQQDNREIFEFYDKMQEKITDKISCRNQKSNGTFNVLFPLFEQQKTALSEFKEVKNILSHKNILALAKKNITEGSEVKTAYQQAFVTLKESYLDKANTRSSSFSILS